VLSIEDHIAVYLILNNRQMSAAAVKKMTKKSASTSGQIRCGFILR